MCHLTKSGQTTPRNASKSEMVRQARSCFKHYYQSVSDGKPRAKIVHFNFMARGEPLVNPEVNEELMQDLSKIDESIYPRFMISTIMPKTMDKYPSLIDRFRLVHPEMCYSLYSVSEMFRAKWLPAALPCGEALNRLVEWQQYTNKLVKIHYALIKDENDSDRDARKIADVIASSGLRVNINLVQYNPFDMNSEAPGNDRYERVRSILELELPDSRIRVIPKVGYDVKASCGMFVQS